MENRKERIETERKGKILNVRILRCHGTTEKRSMLRAPPHAVPFKRKE